MLKKRIIGGIIVRNGIAVQSIGFHRYLPLGDPAILAENLNRWGIDEILLLDISASKRDEGPSLDLVRRVARKCFVPLTVGGGVRNVNDVRSVIGAGGDKIAVNTAACTDPALLRRIADRFGEQCVVASLDAVPNPLGGYLVHSRGVLGAIDLIAMARRFVAEGAGELLLTSVARDGSKLGYDIDLLRLAGRNITVPLIAMGGVGRPEHLLEALVLPNVSGVAAANFFSFTEHSALIAKGELCARGIALRADTYADYSSHTFGFDGRLLKQPDSDLDRLAYEYYPKESI